MYSIELWNTIKVQVVKLYGVVDAHPSGGIVFDTVLEVVATTKTYSTGVSYQPSAHLISYLNDEMMHLFHKLAFLVDALD